MMFCELATVTSLVAEDTHRVVWSPDGRITYWDCAVHWYHWANQVGEMHDAVYVC